jgi:tRNA/rRNA methyltransferase
LLQRPRSPQNRGPAARAAKNMGIGQLAVVDPENFDPDKVLKMATHAAADVVARIRRFEHLAEALADFGYVVGTTARLGGQRKVIGSPARLAESLIPISQHNRIAIVFGPEDRGLTNEDCHLCHVLVNIPTHAFASLNLAQAVMVMAYEIHKAARSETGDFVARLASRHELEGMYAQLKEILVRISFINPENPDYWMNNLRQFFSRLPLRAREVRIIRGICRQMNWYGEKRFADGVKEGRKPCD